MSSSSRKGIAIGQVALGESGAVPYNFDMSKLDQLITALRGEPSVLIAILYGSFGTPRERPDSDIDIAVAGSKAFSTEEKFKILSTIERVTGKQVDLIDLNHASGTVFREALVSERVLKNEDRDLMGRILIRMLSEEEDFQKSKRVLATEARQRIFRVKGSTKSKT
jgi:predicted nucleotidyltransferase